MDSALVSLYCPPMAINFAGWRLMRTAAEPMAATITLQPSGIQFKISKVTIPPTYVRWKSWLSWMVDACPGDGAENAAALHVDLPEEPVLFDPSTLTMDAQPIYANATLTISGGLVFKGEKAILFPLCKAGLSGAPAVTAKGTLLRVA